MFLDDFLLLSRLASLRYNATFRRNGNHGYSLQLPDVVALRNILDIPSAIGNDFTSFASMVGTGRACYRFVAGFVSGNKLGCDIGQRCVLVASENADGEIVRACVHLPLAEFFEGNWSMPFECTEYRRHGLCPHWTGDSAKIVTKNDNNYTLKWVRSNRRLSSSYGDNPLGFFSLSIPTVTFRGPASARVFRYIVGLGRDS